ncbi:MAG: hypothetical protein ACJAQS_001643 [Porticoccus sp.]|jgi:hypothetical protein
MLLKYKSYIFDLGFMAKKNAYKLMTSALAEVTKPSIEKSEVGSIATISEQSHFMQNLVFTLSGKPIL